MRVPTEGTIMSHSL